jgi:L-fucose isomerase
MAHVALLTAVATSSARRLAAAQPGLTIFHHPVWAAPDFTVLAASATSGPLKPPG